MPPAPTNANPPLRAIYRALLKHFGPQHWWPGRTRFEIMVGAILTQNTSWSNVEQAIARLRKARRLHPARLHALPHDRLADLIRPAGYFNVKATRLHAFTGMLQRAAGGSLDRLFRRPTPDLRRLLLGVRGIGPETADSMLLYAAQRPVFVVDAYTRRLMERHGWQAATATYDEVAATFTRAVPHSVPVYNEYHALLVALGKRYCRPTPRCTECPLRRWLPAGVKTGNHG